MTQIDKTATGRRQQAKRFSKRSRRWIAGAAVAAIAIGLAACATTQQGGTMSFFVTSIGGGNGADYGGVTGADQHCQKLAAASGVAGAAGKTWRAYLSQQATGGQLTINARDRIGAGPWFNAKGELIAVNVTDLHAASNRITKQTALDERGQVVLGRGDSTNRHDILTGTKPDGTAYSPNDPDMTCGNWTRNGTEGMAVVGHHDRSGPTTDAWATSWNSSHVSRGGCSQAALKSTGGDGLLYCFAAQ
ncbi:MAG: hypothetical protein AB7G13_13815 [Lautropia sp.]